MPDVLQPAPLTGRWNKRVYYDYQLHYIIHRLTILYICTEEPKARTSTPSSPWGSCESCGLSRPLNGCPSWRYVFQFVTNPVHSEGRLGPQLASIRHAFTSQIHLHYVKNELIYLFSKLSCFKSYILFYLGHGWNCFHYWNSSVQGDCISQNVHSFRVWLHFQETVYWSIKHFYAVSLEGDSEKFVAAPLLYEFQWKAELEQRI